MINFIGFGIPSPHLVYHSSFFNVKDSSESCSFDYAHDYVFYKFYGFKSPERVLTFFYGNFKLWFVGMKFFSLYI
jgi:hypothetical protein